MENCHWKKTYAYHEYLPIHIVVFHFGELLIISAPSCVSSNVSPARARCGEDWEGATAVHLGIKGGHAEVCRFLMEARADPREALDFGTSAAGEIHGF